MSDKPNDASKIADAFIAIHTAELNALLTLQKLLTPPRQCIIAGDTEEHRIHCTVLSVVDFETVDVYDHETHKPRRIHPRKIVELL